MKKIRVVVIDDSAYNRRTITKMLEGLPDVEVVGYAADGEEGIRKIIDLKPDLITLDLEMPRMDGFTLSAHRHERLSHPGHRHQLAERGQIRFSRPLNSARSILSPSRPGIFPMSC